MFLANKGQWKLKILKALGFHPSPVHSKLLGLGVLSATSGWLFAVDSNDVAML